MLLTRKNFHKDHGSYSWVNLKRQAPASQSMGIQDQITYKWTTETSYVLEMCNVELAYNNEAFSLNLKQVP